MSGPRILLSVLSYNGRPWLERCLESLARQRLEEGVLSIRALDNASEDGSWEIIEELRGRLPTLRAERSPVNLGFSAGHNAALREGGWDFVALVNQDCWLEDDGALWRLVEASRRLGPRALLQPVVRDGGSERAWAGLSVSYTGAALPRPFAGGAREPFEVAAVHGAFLWMSRAAVEEAGLLEEAYFAYHEDLEYSMRARLLGMSCWCVPSVEALHEQAPGRFRANRAGRRLMERNRWRYLLSYFSWPLLLALLPALLVQEAAMAAWFFACGDIGGTWRGWARNAADWRALLALRRRGRALLANSPWRRDFFMIHGDEVGASRVAADAAYPFWARAGAGLVGGFMRLYGAVYRVFFSFNHLTTMYNRGKLRL